MVLMLLLGSAAYAAPPSHGTVDGDTWTHVWPIFNYSITYSITPVPEMADLISGEPVFALTRGSVFTMSTAGVDLEVWPITEIDNSDLGEHSLGASIFRGSTYTFNEPGYYLVFFVREGSYITARTVEVN